ncbi:MAG: hypothetical protein WDO69_06545 [Pseudomonadota bacterium]
MSAIDDVDAINDKLREWIITTSPPAGDSMAMAKMKQVVTLHNQLDQQLAKAQLIDLQQANTALLSILKKQGAQVAELKTQIEKVTDGIESAETVISVAAQAVAFLVQVIALVP